MAAIRQVRFDLVPSTLNVKWRTNQYTMLSVLGQWFPTFWTQVPPLSLGILIDPDQLIDLYHDQIDF